MWKNLGGSLRVRRKKRTNGNPNMLDGVTVPARLFPLILYRHLR